MFLLNATLLDGFLKLLFVLSFALYVIFAFVVTRQISIMRNTLITSFSPLFSSAGYVHLVMALLIFFFFLFTL